MASSSSGCIIHGGLPMSDLLLPLEATMIDRYLVNPSVSTWVTFRWDNRYPPVDRPVFSRGILLYAISNQVSQPRLMLCLLIMASAPNQYYLVPSHNLPLDLDPPAPLSPAHCLSPT